MGFLEEVVKPKRKIMPYLQMGMPDNTERLYSYADEGTYRERMAGTVQSFGSFNRSLANALFSIEIPSLNTTLLDPDREWRALVGEPYDELVHQWLEWRLRVHDDDDDIYDGTIAVAQVQTPAFPPGRKVQIAASVAAADFLTAKIPRRTITLDDWPMAPPESVGRAVPIIYGRHTNTVPDILDPVAVNYLCGCPEFTPPPYTYLKPTDMVDVTGVPRPGLRWMDHFTQIQGDVPNTTGGVTLGQEANHPADAWLVNNYHGLWGLNILPNQGPGGIGNALVNEMTGDNVSGYAEITRGIGPQTIGVPYLDVAEPWDTYPAKYGYRSGQYGAAGIYRWMDPVLAEDAPVVLEVWGRCVASGNFANLMSLLTWWGPGSDIVTDVVLWVNGGVHRRNGAYVWGGELDPQEPTPFPLNDGDSAWEPQTSPGFYQTRAMLGVLIPSQWQMIEMKWKISSRVSQTVFAGENEHNAYNADGWVEVRVDGQLVIILQEILFHLNVGTDTVNESDGEAATYWEGVAYRPQGKAACLYLSDRLYPWEMEPVTVADANPCITNVSAQGGGAFTPILVDVQTRTVLSRVSGIGAPAQDNAAAPTGEQGFTEVGGSIPGGTSSWYRVTAVYGGAESSWSGLIEVYNDEAYRAHITWEDPPQGPPDSFRIYQMTSDDVQLHQDMGGTLRADTYWVKQVSGTTHEVYFNSIGDGAPQQAAASGEVVETTWVLAGHTATVDQAYGLLPGMEEMLGGLNLETGEKEPIRHEETALRQTLLLEGAEYTVEVVEKSSGRFTVIRVTRNMRSNSDCSYRILTVNCTGIREDANDASSDVIEDGPQIVKHFMLNFVHNNYTTGEWFEDTPNLPGLVDKESFDTATEVGESFVEGGRIGAVILDVQQDVRTHLMDAITSFGMGLYYRNAIANENGAWAGVIIDARNVDPGDLPLFQESSDIIQETFGFSFDYLSMANVINYKAGPNHGIRVQEGWLISGTLTDGDSINRYERLERDLIMPWTRHTPTALDVAQQMLEMLRWPLLFASFQTKGRGMAFDPGRLIAVEHTDGSGNGWDQHPCIIIGNDYNIDDHRTTLRLMSAARLI